MTTPVPIPQDATVGFDQPQQSQAAPTGSPTGGSASKGVPIPADATVGYGEPQQSQAAQAPPEGQTAVGSALETPPIKTSDIPLPSKDATGGYTDQHIKSLPMDWSGLKGLGQDLIGAAKGAVSGAVDMVKPPKDNTEKAIQVIGGPAALPIYHALVAAGHTVKEATEIIGAVKDINNSDDPLGAYAKVAQKTSSQGGAQAILALATEGALKAAPKVGEAAGAAYKNVSGKINPSYIQEPLQKGVRDIIADSAKGNPVEAAPEPKYIYRARDVGEVGVPKPHSSSHGQAMTDADVAKQDAEPGQRGSTGTGGNAPAEDRPQEVVRVDLNKLKPEDYRLNTARAPVVEGATPARGGDKYDFPNGLPEESLEKVTPELEKQEAAEAKSLADEKVAANKPPSKSIRNTAHEAGDRIMADAKSDYAVLDKESNGRFQRFRDKMEANRRAMRDLTTSEEDVAKESRILKSQKEVEDEMGELYDEMKKKGVNPDLIDRADRNYRRAQGAYDVGDAIRRNVKGAHPDTSRADIIEHSPETLDPKGFHKTINRLYDSGRLQDFLGESGAEKMFDHSLEHSAAYDKVLRNRKLAFMGGGAAAGMSLGTGGYYAHRLLSSVEGK
jgi:hypothetical protein